MTSQCSSNSPALVRQRLVYTKDKTPRHKQSNVVNAIQCQEECNKLYIGEINIPSINVWHSTDSFSSTSTPGRKWLWFRNTEDEQVRVLEREDHWFKRGVKEAILVKLKKPSLLPARFRTDEALWRGDETNVFKTNFKSSCTQRSNLR